MNDNCQGCPPSCMGHIVDSKCVTHDGQSLHDVLKSPDPVSNVQAQEVNTTDDIVSNAERIAVSSLCFSNISNRNYDIGLTASASSYLLDWDLSPFIGDLPGGYSVRSQSVQVQGKTKVVASSNKVSAGVTVPANQFPVSVTVTVRVSSDCGDFAVTDYLVISSADTGSQNGMLSFSTSKDREHQPSLTAHLNDIESAIQKLERDRGRSLVSYNGSQITLTAALEIFKGELEAVITDQSQEVESLKAENTSLRSTLSSLQEDFRLLATRVSNLESTN